MRAAVYRRFGAAEVVVVDDVPTPEPRGDQVRVRVIAAEIGASDVAARSGKPLLARLGFGPLRPRLPILGGDFVGEVSALGSDASGFALGDRVLGTTGAGMGAHAEYVLVSSSAVLAHLPEGIDPITAAALVDATALSFLTEYGHLHPGERLLVNGASGAVGTAAVQLGVHLGAGVVGTSSPANLASVLELGAEAALDHSDPAGIEAAGPYDVVFDAYGRLGYRSARAMLTPSGRYLTTVPSLGILWHAVISRMAGARRASIAFTGLRSPERKLRDLRYHLELASQGALTAPVEATYPLERAAEAHRHVERGKRGHIVITM